MIVFTTTPTPILAEGVEIWGAIKQDPRIPYIKGRARGRTTSSYM